MQSIVAYALEAPVRDASTSSKNYIQQKISDAKLVEIGLSAEERAWLLAHPVIKVGVHTAYMPIEFFSEANRFRGITVDYMQRLESILGVSFKKSDYETNSTPDIVDMISASTNPKLLEKNGFVSLDEPLLTFPYAIYTHVKTDNITSWDDLDGKRVAVFKKGAMPQILAKFPTIKIIPVNLAEDAFVALQEGTADAYIGNEMVVDYVSNIQGLNYIKKISDTPYKANTYMLVRADWPQLKSILQKTLLYVEPEKSEIVGKWDLANNQRAKQILQIALGALLLLIASISFRSYRLKQTIKTQEKLSQERIWHQANFDFLTSLPNRMMFQNRLQEEIKKSERSNLPLGLLYLDLDNFKQINDQLGHATGDELIKEVAKRVSACIRSIDTTARIGGDEFTVIMGDLTDINALENVSIKILSRLEQPFNINQQNIYITASIGITVYPNDSRKMEELLMFADQAMYEAKRLGKNRYQFFTSSMQEFSINRHTVTNDLRTAMASNEFVMFYQPIVDFNNDTITKAEALIRWRHPTKGLVSPMEFIPIAEDTGMISQLGDWVFEQTLKDVSRLRSTYHPDFQISLNVSPRQFLNETNLLSWLSKMTASEIPGDAITLEITEGMLLQPTDSVKHILTQFIAADISISIDDFGTGYSALGYLKKFNVDYVKLDRSFVQHVEFDKDNKVLCEAIIDMAHRLGIKVVAEGIETKAQERLLKQFKCDYGQGYLFAKPTTIVEFEKFLSAVKKLESIRS
ncbi:MAG TPA: EAL domain-containing protein [Methylotenera sp.]|nr:EAL domain-containing protein [Methylotenera sp.]